ncbi:MAG: hypothetical protein IPP58_14880 [Holophagaceae bacterium]|uniref:Uncharacterized protein n=1 Tax=Candidatus Geothrix skivensis TaxID=2954439 RepID=A0A9D7SJT8_9BACT|nr:hypothetical protein [Candidatus Geothrix skivensis]
MALFSKWRSLGQLVSTLLVALLLSCGGGGGNPPPPEGNLRVFNDGNLTLRHLYVTPSTSSSWGVDQLAPSFLLPGESITLTRLYPGSYDVQARFSDGSWDQVYDVRIQDQVTTILSMLNTGNGAVAVFNNSGFTLNGIYLTPSISTTWGPNQADLPLLTGQTLTLTGVAPGTYDLRVVFSGGSSLDTRGISVIAGATSTIQVN